MGMIKRIITTTLFILCTQLLLSQSRIDSIAFRAMQVGRVMQQERVFLHFDNSAYYIGETIWFKAYVSFGSNNRPSTLSKVLYVELVAPEGYIVETKKYKLDDNGCCHGEFELNPLILSGYYEIRAYTRYMLNWGDEAIFSRVFPVFDKVNANNWDFKNMLDRKRGFMHNGNWISAQLPDATLDFYPEGGNLVEGIESRIAYELREADGLFCDEKITIYENGNKLLESTPIHQGKGVFTLTPKSGADYRAELFIKNEKGKKKKHSFKLPKIAEEGAVIKVEDVGDSIEITYSHNLTDAKELGFLILHRGTMGFYEKRPAGTRKVSTRIAKSALPEGVCRAVLFTDNDTPLAERQFFVVHDTPENEDISTVKLRVQANGSHPDNLSPAPGEKITLKITREDGKPLKPGTSLSLSISDAATAQKTSYGYNLYTHMLLGSELKGYIPDAAQYFDPHNSNRQKHLDLIMLTHGWTSYDWNRLTRKKIMSMQPIERGITLKGKFFLKRRSDDFGSKGNTIIIPQKYNLTRIDIATDGKQVQTTTFRTDSTGSFVIELDDFYGTRIASMSPQTAMKQSSDRVYRFALDRYYSPGFRLFDYWERHLGAAMSRSMSDSIVKLNPFEYMLSSVEVVGQKREQINTRPPHSEIRLNYLDEWEYAQDITYVNMFYTYEDEIYRQLVENADLYKDLEGGSTEVEKLFANMNYDDGEIISVYDEGRIATKYLGNMRISPDSMRNRMTVDHDFDHILTAADVVSSAMRRHNYNWSYWTQLMVVKGKYSPSSTPEPDLEYLRGLPDAEKMTNFKEFVIRSDENVRSQFENRDTYWGPLARMLDNKRPISKFYLGFLSQMYLFAGDGIDGCPDHNTFLSRIMIGKGISNPIHPNYVACLIPYSDEDSCGITPEYAATGSSLRYTSIQGYSQSKNFYSPDYSSMKPVEEDYRRTLLWAPEVTIENGEATAELYNNNDCRNIEVSIEGRNGRVLFSNSPITVTRIHPEAENAVPHKAIVTDKEREEQPLSPELLADCAREHNKGVILYNQKRYRNAITIFAELVQYKYAPSMRYIALCYLNGTGINKNLQLAFKFMQEAAERGCAEAQFELSEFIQKGTIAESNDTLAHEWLCRAAGQNEPRALIELAYRYINGTMVEKDEKKGEELLKSAADTQYPEALFEYGSYLTGHNRDGIGYIKDAARLKSHRALLYMLDYEHNAGNYKEAYRYARELSLLGNSSGTKRMADYYYEGKGVSRDKQLAKDLYREAANAGNEEAAEILKKL